MSLPDGQQRVLDGIAETLRVTEPRLTGMFAVFTRLTKNEPRPGREEVAPPRPRNWLTACARRLFRSPLTREAGLGWRRFVMAGQLAIAVAMFALLIGVGSHAVAGCGGSARSTASAVASSPHATCPPPGGPGGLLGGK